MNSYTIQSDKELEKFGYTPKLKRTLSTWELASFGLAYLQPIGPAVIFGFLLLTSQGSVALPYLFAFIGMLFTIQSYAILIKEYPLAGSVYNYVKLSIGARIGFIAGWLLALDYILIPTITSTSASVYAHQLIPSIPYEAWLCIFVLMMGLLNLIGIKSTSLFSSGILLIQILIVIAGLIIWTFFIVKHHGISGVISIKPFQFGSFSCVAQASSLAIFSFLGFDAITTLAEESINPKRDIPKAMIICTCIGFAIMFVTGYLGVLVIPDWKNLFSDVNWVNATLFSIAKITGGETFALIYGIGFILAMMISNLVGTTAATRLLYGMGRDGVLVKSIFGVANKRWKTPHGNIIFIVLIELLLGSFANPDQLAALINYGAVLGFMLLNLCVIYIGIKRCKNNSLIDLIKFYVLPATGVCVMITIFLSMNIISILFGTLWLLAGLIFI